VRTDNRALGLIADLGIDEVDAADLLLVPGGYGERLLERDPRMLEDPAEHRIRPGPTPGQRQRRPGPGRPARAILARVRARDAEMATGT
jgi:hypothetical protein